MFFLIDKENNSTVSCPETDFSRPGSLECLDLAIAIEQHPLVLGEELLIISDECLKFAQTKENVNLLALDKHGNLVIINLRFGDSGDNDALHPLAYAAAGSLLLISDLVDMYVRYQKYKGIQICPESAQEIILGFIDDNGFKELNYQPRIILAARVYRPGVIPSILWLRRFGIDITCVKWQAFDLPDKHVVFNFHILIPSVGVEEAPRFETECGSWGNHKEG